MSLLLAMIFSQGLSQAADTGTEPEIVVIASKLSDWRGTWKVKKGRIVCQSTKSTGDLEVDAIGCQALEVCLTPHAAEMDAIVDSKEPKAIKQQKFSDMLKPIGPCVFSERQKGIAALADRRAGS